jgi:hypothetical protein
LAAWTGRAVQAANSTTGATSGNLHLHLVIRSASQMKQASDSAPGPTKRQAAEQALWARHDRMRGSRARASLFYRDRTGLAHHGDGGRIPMRACSARGGAATAVSASTVEADRESLLVCELGLYASWVTVQPTKRHSTKLWDTSIRLSARRVVSVGMESPTRRTIDFLRRLSNKTLVECCKQRQQVSRLPEYSVRPRVRQFE